MHHGFKQSTPWPPTSPAKTTEGEGGTEAGWCGSGKQRSFSLPLPLLLTQVGTLPDLLASLRTVFIDNGVEVEGKNTSANVQSILNFAGVKAKALLEEEAAAVVPSSPRGVPRSPMDQPLGDTFDSERLFQEFCNMNKRIRLMGLKNDEVLAEVANWHSRFIHSSDAEAPRSATGARSEGATIRSQLAASEVTSNDNDHSLLLASRHDAESRPRSVSRPWRWVPLQGDFSLTRDKGSPGRRTIVASEGGGSPVPSVAARSLTSQGQVLTPLHSPSSCKIAARQEFTGTPPLLVKQSLQSPYRLSKESPDHCLVCGGVLVCTRCCMIRHVSPFLSDMPLEAACREMETYLDELREREEDTFQKYRGREDYQEVVDQLRAKYNDIMMTQPWASWLRQKDCDMYHITTSTREKLAKAAAQHDLLVKECASREAELLKQLEEERDRAARTEEGHIAKIAALEEAVKNLTARLDGDTDLETPKQQTDAELQNAVRVVERKRSSLLQTRQASLARMTAELSQNRVDAEMKASVDDLFRNYVKSVTYHLSTVVNEAMDVQGIFRRASGTDTLSIYDTEAFGSLEWEEEARQIPLELKRRVDCRKRWEAEIDGLKSLFSLVRKDLAGFIKVLQRDKDYALSDAEQLRTMLDATQDQLVHVKAAKESLEESIRIQVDSPLRSRHSSTVAFHRAASTSESFSKGDPIRGTPTLEKPKVKQLLKPSAKRRTHLSGQPQSRRVTKRTSLRLQEKPVVLAGSTLGPESPTLKAPNTLIMVTSDDKTDMLPPIGHHDREPT